jgi:hypothetical protein
MSDYDKILKALEEFSFSHGESQERKWIEFNNGNVICRYEFDNWGYLTNVKYTRAGTINTLG